jgi:hypothetical protein
MLAKIISEVDDLKAMLRDQKFEYFEENYEDEEE